VAFYALESTSSRILSGLLLYFLTEDSCIETIETLPQQLKRKKDQY